MSDVFPQRREELVPISGPAPAAGAAFVAFVAQAASWTSADIPVGNFSELAIDFDVTAVTAGSVQLAVDRKDAAGKYEQVALAVAKTAAATDVASVGDGMPTSAALGTATGVSTWSVGVAFGDVIRIRLIMVTGPFSATLSVKGKQ